MKVARKKKDSLSPGEIHAMGTQPLEAHSGVYGTQAMTQLWKVKSLVAT